MKKIIAFALVAGLLVFSGCSLFKKDPQKAVNKGVLAFTEVEKMNFKMNVNSVKIAPAGEKPAKTQIVVDGSGKSDSSDPKNWKLDADAKLNFTIDDQKASGQVLLKWLNKKNYFNLKTLDIASPEGESLEKNTASLMNQWWVVPLSEGGIVDQYAEQFKKLQEKLKTTKLFVNAREEGKEDVQGIPTTLYRVDVDKEALKALIIDFARSTENQLDPRDEEAITEGLKEDEFSGILYVGNKDGIVHRIRGTVTVQPVQGPNSTFDIDISGWDYDKDVEIKAPENAKDFSTFIAVPFLEAFRNLSAPAEAAAGDGAAVKSVK